MKRAIFLALFLFIGVTVIPVSHNSAQNNDGFQSFWKKFKTAVTRGDGQTVAALSQFPLGIASPALNVKDRPELRQRYREIFAEKVNASECFAHTEPTQDTERKDLFTVACRYAEGSDAAAYQFERTRLGWRFTHYQSTTTCRCR